MLGEMDELSEDERWRLTIEARLFALQTAFLDFVVERGAGAAMTQKLETRVEQGRETSGGTPFEELIIRSLEELSWEIAERETPPA
jgi:hypothetical protein